LLIKVSDWFCCLSGETDGIEVLNYTLRLSINTSFKNSTKTFPKVLCVNFLELFFSTAPPGIILKEKVELIMGKKNIYLVEITGSY